VRRRSDPRRTVHSEADVPLVSDLGLSRMETHAHPNLGAFRPCVLRQGTLGDYGGAQG
jgi:hypothetical protein